MLDLLYGELARWRRRSGERRPDQRRRLVRPVVSIGNLSMGGTGKSPVVAALAEWLVQQGERPAILSRGYRRRDEVPGVVVVSDGQAVRAGLARAGDEPLMLARAVPGAVVCVCPDRHLAGVLAERALGATVHLLDDGFQHLGLARDLDVLVTTRGEIPGGRMLPYGRLREPLDAAARAHVLVVMGATAGAAAAEGWALGVGLTCGGVRELGAPVRVLPAARGSGVASQEPVTQSAGVEPRPEDPVVVACGIANPQRFVEDVKAAGWRIAREVVFPDHHPYSARDIARMAAAVRDTGATAVLTTDKDAVRLEDLGPWPFALFRVPMRVRFEPADVLVDSVAAVLARRGEASAGRRPDRGVDG